MLERTLIDDILQHADIVNVISSYINVVKKGRNYAAICPFHDDKNPSLMISKEKQIFKCFVCQEGGNAITFIQKYENLNFEEAVRKLAELIGYDDPRLHTAGTRVAVDEKLPFYNALNDLTEFYMMSLNAKEGEEGRAYLKKRSLDDEIIKNFSIGYCPSNAMTSIGYMQASSHSVKTLETIGIAGHNGTNYFDRNAGRIIFPLRDSNGQVVGYSARDISGKSEAKYINSPETPVFHKGNNLYNYYNAKKVARLSGFVYIVEGFMDAIALYRIGIESVVALMGTAMTNNQVDLLRRLNAEVRICFDGDAAGQMATIKNIQLLDKANVKYRIVKKDAALPKDCDEILTKLGAEKLKDYLHNLVDKPRFAFTYYQENNAMSTIDERQRFIKDILPLLGDIKSTLELEDYILNIARISGFDVKIIRQIVEKSRVRHQEGADALEPVESFDKLIQHKQLTRLLIAERAMVYHLLSDKKAMAFYENNTVLFSDDVYRKIVSYIAEYYKEHSEIDLNGLFVDIEMNHDEKSKDLVATISQIVLEKNNYAKCDDESLRLLKTTIDGEREKQYDDFIYKESKKGKTNEEKIRLMLERNKKLGEKLYKGKKE